MSDVSPPGAPLQAPIARITEPFVRFMHVESASGIVLLAAAGVALLLANSAFSEGYLAFWKTPVGFEVGSFQMRHSLQHWINDGLMAIFFFVIGLEVKREIVHGELGNLRQAALPIAAAAGGMLVPAAIYLGLQGGGSAASGWGIPMATDIAFAVGCLALLGSRVPHAFRVLVVSLAIVDDIGAILVIAIGYTDAISWDALAVGAAGVTAIALFARLGVRGFTLYIVLGTLAWAAFHESGIHATLEGVILGLLTPARAHLADTRLAHALERLRVAAHGDWGRNAPSATDVRGVRWVARETVSPLEYLEHTLHPWVGFAVMPIFALANAGVPIEAGYFTDPVALAVAAGLVIGKPVGALGFCWVAVRLGIAVLPTGVSWGLILGGGFLAGIGFTMALFIAGLALPPEHLDAAKVGILAGSSVAAAMGMTVLLRVLGRTPPRSD